MKNNFLDSSKSLAIKAEGIFKNFNNIKIIDNISLTVPNGAFVAIMGPSGSGKTTLLNLLSGLDKPDSGEIKVNGTSISSLKEPKLTKFRSLNFSYIFQDYNLIDFLTVEENIKLYLKLLKIPFDKGYFEEIISICDLSQFKKRKVDFLSGGQKQRVAIARAALTNSKIIFADEPTGALDLNTREKIMNLLKDLWKKTKKTIIMITHDPFVASYAESVVFILNGAIKEISSKINSQEIAVKIDDLERKNV